MTIVTQRGSGASETSRTPAASGQRPGPAAGGPQRDHSTTQSGPSRSTGRSTPVDVVPTLLGQLALLGGAGSLTAVLVDGAWVLPLLEVLGVVWLLGIGCRLMRSPAPVTVLAQFVGMAAVLTSLFSSSGIAGFIPTPAVFRDAGGLLSDAWQQILSTVPPTAATPSLSFLVCLTLGTTALVVDFLIAETRSPALVALPLLCLYSVPASIAPDSLPWWTFVAPALLYAALLAVTGRVLTRSRGRVTLSVVVAGMLIAGLGTAGGLLIGDSVTAVGTDGSVIPRNKVGGNIGLNPFTSLSGDLKQTDPTDLLRVRNQPTDDYLRVLALEQWTAGNQAGFGPSTLTSDADPATGAVLRSVPGEIVAVSVESLRWSSEWLPVFAGTQSVTGLSGSWNYDRELNTIYTSGTNNRVNPRAYTVNASFDKPTADELRQDSVTASAELIDAAGVPTSVRDQAREVTADARTAFDKADALYRWFTDPINGFTYSLSVPDGSSGDALADFLVNRKGFCEQYASAMTAMLRTLNIPARVAIGFTQGRQGSDGTRVISTNDAHAWVEVRFDEHGWVRFDPTPLGGNAGQHNGFTDPAGNPSETSSGTGSGSATTSTETSTTTRTTSTRNLGEGGNAIDDDETSSGDSTLPGQAAGPSGLAAIPAVVWWSIAVVIALALLALIPRQLRRRRRSSRLATVRSGGPGAAAAAWAEIEALMTDHRIPLVPTESTRTTANRLARVASLPSAGRERLRGLVISAEHAWYSSGAVATETDPQQLVEAVEAVDTGLSRVSPLTVTDKWWPRSVRPVR